MKSFLLFLLPMLVSAQDVTVAGLRKKIARYAPADIRVDVARFSAGDRKALPKLIEAARVIDVIFLKQLWSGNEALYSKLQKDSSEQGRARLHYFLLNKGPWSDLDGHAAFLPDVPTHKPPGANFYPPDMTKEQFETWVKGLPREQKELAEGFFSVVRRESGKLRVVPYSKEYRRDLERAAALLREAAALTENESLKRFLTSRADAFLSNDYYASDLAWMDLDAPLDITIGPYETYNDEIFGYKAGYEAYVNIRDEAETAKLKFFADHLQEVENALPIEAKYRNPKLGASAPIRVVNEVFAAGDGDHGVRTAAYNLPNDERVIAQKGSKRVMLKNVQEAKFVKILQPIARRVLPGAAAADLSFDAFFTHILAHEMSHGIGPHQIRMNGAETSVRKELKELYSAIEEAKADITGLFLLQYLYDHKLMPTDASTERKLYTTFLASSFRTMRFGLKEAHGKGMAMQVNYLLDKGAFVQGSDGTYSVVFDKVKRAVRDLTHDLLTLEATGDYAGAKRMLDTLGVIRPPMQRAIERLNDLATDIEPVFVTAKQVDPKLP